MKIKTRFNLTLAVFGVTLVPIAASLVVTARQVEQVQQRQARALALELGARELSYVSNDFLLNRESLQRNRWEVKIAALSEDVQALLQDDPEQRALVGAIEENHRRLRAVFNDVVSTIGNPTANRDGAAVMAFIRVAWSRMEVQSQEAAFNAARLSRMLEDQVDGLRRRNVTLIFVIVGASGAFLLANYTLVQRDVLKAIADLQTGTGVVGSGNLDHAIEVRHSDEIGDLARSFNRMTASLREVTASKADLEREIAEREKAQAELVDLSADIAQQNVELETANRDLESFIASVSHDLRQPLRAMHSFSHLLTRDYAGRLDDRGRDYLERVCRGTEKMSGLIEDLLALAQVSRQELERTVVDLSAVAAAIVADLRQAEPERRVEVVVQERLVVSADPRMLEIALSNLLGNAWKFTSKQERARIEFGAFEQDGDLVYVVRDNGAGFDSKHAGKAFQPFQRLHADRDFEGTGIGLSIVERVIRRHGGAARIEGEPGKGAAVYFTLR